MKRFASSIAVAVGLLAVAAVAAAMYYYRAGSLPGYQAEIVLAALLTAATISYSLLVLLTLVQTKEQSVQPIVSLDLILFGKDRSGVGIRILNGGAGPALNLSLHVLSEPDNGSFQISGLDAVKDGLAVLPVGDPRVLSIGQKYDALLNLGDGSYVVEARYSSVRGTSYCDRYTLKPVRDFHILRSSLPFHE